MLTTLRIENFAIIDQLELSFRQGLVILTGETGAGKSIILDAIMALLGGPFDATSIRAGAAKSRIEATFSLADCPPELALLLAQEDLREDQDILTIEREMRLEGRTSARVNGRGVTQSTLRAIGDLLVDIHGQSEHLSLLNTRAHIGLLDSFAGDEAQLQQYQHGYQHLLEIRRELRELLTMEQEAATRLELLSFQEQEISAARLHPGEDEQLDQERNRLANAENLALAAQGAITLLDDPSPEMQSITDLLGQLNHQLQQLARLDATQTEIEFAGNSLMEQAEELAREVRNYVDGIEFNPRRLEEIEERIGLLNNLKRKYGGSIESVLSYLAVTHQKLELINTSGERIAELHQQEQAMLSATQGQAIVLSNIRKVAAERLSREIEKELDELKMEGARFQVGFETLPPSQHTQGSTIGLDGHGMDWVQFLIAPNPGEGLNPLVKIASGGETSRLMLALKNVLAKEDRIPSLVFDEIDQGIGGRVGSIVGKKLWQLARHHQVFCVTHLPQLAAYGDQHFNVSKVVAHGRTITQVAELAREDRIVELAQMLGHSTENTLRSAEELLQQVEDLE